MTPALRQVDDVTWEIPIGARPGMRVPARLIADARLEEELADDASRGPAVSPRRRRSPTRRWTASSTSCTGRGIARRMARLVPLGMVKG